MKRLLAVLFILAVLPMLAGTKEDIEKIQSDLRALESKFGNITLEIQDIKKRLETVEARLESVSRASQTADVRLDLDELRRKLDKLSNDLEELKTAGTGVTPPVAAAAPEYQRTEEKPPQESPDVMYQDAYREYLQGHYELAVSGYNKFLELYPGHPLAENSMYWIGESYYGLKKFSEAKAALLKTMEKYPHGSKFLSAKLKLALACFHNGEKEDCRRLLKEITASAPSSQEAEIADEKLKALFRD
jgi:tol-pal system protein YbgF